MPERTRERKAITRLKAACTTLRGLTLRELTCERTLAAKKGITNPRQPKKWTGENLMTMPQTEVNANSRS